MLHITVYSSDVETHFPATSQVLHLTHFSPLNVSQIKDAVKSYFPAMRNFLRFI